MYTDQPGVQFYTGNFLPEAVGKNNTKFGKHSAFCLETQNYPNAINIVSKYVNEQKLIKFIQFLINFYVMLYL